MSREKKSTQNHGQIFSSFFFIWVKSVSLLIQVSPVNAQSSGKVQIICLKTLSATSETQNSKETDLTKIKLLTCKEWMCDK